MGEGVTKEAQVRHRHCLEGERALGTCRLPPLINIYQRIWPL